MKSYSDSQVTQEQHEKLEIMMREKLDRIELVSTIYMIVSSIIIGALAWKVFFV